MTAAASGGDGSHSPRTRRTSTQLAAVAAAEDTAVPTPLSCLRVGEPHSHCHLRGTEHQERTLPGTSPNQRLTGAARANPSPGSLGGVLPWTEGWSSPSPQPSPATGSPTLPWPPSLLSSPIPTPPRALVSEVTYLLCRSAGL